MDEPNLNPIKNATGAVIGYRISNTTVWQCQRCNHEWHANSRTRDAMPKACPNCKVYKWYIPNRETD